MLVFSPIKLYLKKLVVVAMRNSTVHNAFEKSLGWVVDYARIIRREHLRAISISNSPRLSFIESSIPSLVVSSGPFRGMRYPRADAIGSALVPKLLGCYEQELHQLIEGICQTEYHTVIDIGCAEGYYAVGFALRLPAAKVIAFDTNSDATRLCAAMAEANGAQNRLLVGAMCDPDTLAQFAHGPKILIVCDCEGYERELFPTGSGERLKRHDLLIELHDFIHPGISSTIQNVFSETHEIEVFTSISDADKARTYSHELLAGLSLQEKEELLAEGRPTEMQWYFLRAKFRQCEQ
jgi:hypothetical protein